MFAITALTLFIIIVLLAKSVYKNANDFNNVVIYHLN